MPSTRFRWSQYCNDLCSRGIDITEYSSTYGAYAPQDKFSRPIWLSQTLLDSLVRSVSSRTADVCFLQRNLIATLYTWEWTLKKPIAFDVDDAIHCGPRGKYANKIAERANVIICGNKYLADHFCKYGNIEILPTAIDVDRFVPLKDALDETVIIGWSGTSGGFQYLYMIEDALAEVLRARPQSVIKIVSDRPPQFQLLPIDQIHYVEWSPSIEVSEVQSFTIGIMPLIDNDWARGKCSFKMLTYMAVGIPVVVSPVGMNNEVLSMGACGLSAQSKNQWVETLVHLIDDLSSREKMGATGRSIVEAHYSRKVIGPKLARILKEIA